jgi:ketosteroid isomerase-like protein
MFERYTEKARRLIFFARFEASQYGSPYIETEHLLLGLVREDGALLKHYLGPAGAMEAIRVNIESRITRGERFSTAVEVPLADDCKKALNLAGEEADRLGHRHIGTEHVLLALLMVESSLAAKLLREKGLKTNVIRRHLRVESGPAIHPQTLQPNEGPIAALDRFFVGIKGLNSEELMAFFAKNAEFIDASGKRWNRDEIKKGFETLFAPYAKRNATLVVESRLAETGEVFVATVLWKNALLASEHRAWMHRMSVVLLSGADGWETLLAQVTPVQLS